MARLREMNEPNPKLDVKEARDVVIPSRSTGARNLENGGSASMIPTDHGTAGGSAGSGNTGSLGLADRLSLAAAPTFAIMALLLIRGSESSALGGMVLMYLLMTAFHLVPWLNLISSRRSRPAASKSRGRTNIIGDRKQ